MSDDTVTADIYMRNETARLVDLVNAGLEDVGDGSAADLTIVVLNAIADWSLPGMWFYHGDFVVIADEVAKLTASSTMDGEATANGDSAEAEDEQP